MSFIKKRKITVYSSKSILSNPVDLLGAMFHDLIISGELAYRLAVRDVSAKYKQSLLGVLWAFLPPILTTAIFVLLNKSNVIELSFDNHVPYIIYVLIGVVFWQLFTDSINAPIRMVNQNKSMLTKLTFPKEALIIAGIYQVLFDFAIKLLILACFILYYKVPLSASIVLLPLFIFMILLLGTLIGMLLVPAAMLFEDISAGLPSILSLWFFITPVAYAIPESGTLAKIMNTNPISHLIIAGRDSIISWNISNWDSVFSIVTISLLAISLVWILYRLALTVLLERL
jgi:lipopolysaccharide transport system permease protein